MLILMSLNEAICWWLWLMPSMVAMITVGVKISLIALIGREKKSFLPLWCYEWAGNHKMRLWLFPRFPRVSPKITWERAGERAGERATESYRESHGVSLALFLCLTLARSGTLSAAIALHVYMYTTVSSSLWVGWIGIGSPGEVGYIEEEEEKSSYLYV